MKNIVILEMFVDIFFYLILRQRLRMSELDLLLVNTAAKLQ